MSEKKILPQRALQLDILVLLDENCNTYYLVMRYSIFMEYCVSVSVCVCKIVINSL